MALARVAALVGPSIELAPEAARDLPAIARGREGQREAGSSAGLAPPADCMNAFACATPSPMPVVPLVAKQGSKILLTVSADRGRPRSAFGPYPAIMTASPLATAWSGRAAIRVETPTLSSCPPASRRSHRRSAAMSGPDIGFRCVALLELRDDFGMPFARQTISDQEKRCERRAA
jgi:hypothetical protein